MATLRTHRARNHRRLRAVTGFTLVELLVVIAIISLLIAIILPVATALQRQARKVQCMANLRSGYQAFQLYASDNKGYWPVVHNGTVSTPTKNLFYWFNALSRYLDLTQSQQRPYPDLRVRVGPVKWGCPEWGSEKAEAYFYGSGAAGHENGYGMNLTPGWLSTTRVVDDQFLGYPPDHPTATTVWHPLLRQTYWIRFRTGGQRLLLADSAREAIWSGRVMGTRWPPSIGPQRGRDLWPVGGIWTTSRNRTTADLYRHGVQPEFLAGSDDLEPNGGRVNYNVLYCDGHVENHTHGNEAFRSVRMRFPG